MSERDTRYGKYVWPAVLAAGGSLFGASPMLKDYYDNGKVDGSNRSHGTQERIYEEQRTFLDHLREALIRIGS